MFWELNEWTFYFLTHGKFDTGHRVCWPLVTGLLAHRSAPTVYVSRCPCLHQLMGAWKKKRQNPKGQAPVRLKNTFGILSMHFWLCYFIFCVSGLSCDSLVSAVSPCVTYIPETPSDHNIPFIRCLWSHVIWFSLHCPSVGGSWWGLREPSLLFSWEHVPKQHLAVPHSQTRSPRERERERNTHRENLLYLTISVCPTTLAPTICASAAIPLNLIAVCCLLFKISLLCNFTSAGTYGMG